MLGCKYLDRGRQALYLRQTVSLRVCYGAFMRVNAIRLSNMPKSLPAGSLPMPADIFDCAPESAGLPTIYHGPLLALCRAFWRGGCELHGVTCDADLMAISGLHTRRWQIMRAPIIKAFEALKPIMTTVYARQASIAATRQAVSRNATQASLARHARHKASNVKLSDDIPITAPLVPVKSTKSLLPKENKMARGAPALLVDSIE